MAISDPIPLTEAAREVYDATRGTRAAQMAEVSHRGASIVLHWYGKQMMVYGKIAVEGRKRGSGTLEPVPQDIFDTAFLDHAATSIGEHGQQAPLYTNLVMSRADIPSQVELMKTLFANA